MKKKTSKNYQNQILGIKINKSDLEQIIDDFGLKGFSYKIDDNEYEYENINELIDNRGVRPKSFRVFFTGEMQSLSYPEIVLKFSGNSVSITTSNEKALAIELSERLKSKQTAFSHALNPVKTYFLLVIIAFMTYYEWESLLSFSGYKWNHWLYIILNLLAITSFYYHSHYLGVTLEKEHELGFFNKNKEKIIIMIIGAFLGLLIKMIYDYFSK